MGQLAGRCLVWRSCGDELLLRLTKFAANFLTGVCTLMLVVGDVEGDDEVTI